LVLPSEARRWRNDSFHIGILLEKSSDFVQETHAVWYMVEPIKKHQVYLDVF